MNARINFLHCYASPFLVTCAAVLFLETPRLAVAVTAAVAHCDGASEQGPSSSSQLRKRRSTYTAGLLRPVTGDVVVVVIVLAPAAIDKLLDRKTRLFSSLQHYNDRCCCLSA